MLRAPEDPGRAPDVAREAGPHMPRKGPKLTADGIWFPTDPPWTAGVGKNRTTSAGLMREYGVYPEKTRKYLPAVARLHAGRSSKAGLQADLQTPGSPPPPASTAT